MASITLQIYFYEQAIHIRGPLTNFAISLWPLNSLLAILVTYWIWNNEQIGIRSSASQRTNKKQQVLQRNLVEIHPVNAIF
jgi:hypothetical protein